MITVRENLPDNYIFVMEMNESVHLHLCYEAPQMEVVAMTPHHVILGSQEGWGEEEEDLG